jgi:hypothetical protein
MPDESTNPWVAAEHGWSRPVAAPLERCAELLGVTVDRLAPVAARIEPYQHAKRLPVLEPEPARAGAVAGAVRPAERQDPPAPQQGEVRRCVARAGPVGRDRRRGRRCAVSDLASDRVEIPADRLPCPRCQGLGHLDPSRIKGACLGTWWDMTVDPPVERVCGAPVPDREHGRAGRRCGECRRQGTRLAELRGGAS